MRRHETDAVSLIAGLLFLVTAGVHITARSTDTDLNLRWMVPAVLVLLGVLGLLSAVRFPRSSAGDPAPTVEPPSTRGDGADDTAIVERPVLAEGDEAATER